MARNGKTNSTDAARKQVASTLEAYKADHSRAKIAVRRQNSVSLRIRIIDPDFSGIDRVDRETKIWNLLDRLPEAIQSEITMLLLLTPAETDTSFANLEFEHPIPSRL